ncbi:MAG TPA: hypothetical protein VGG51_06490 [Candidatus Cybelea sp.]
MRIDPETEREDHRFVLRFWREPSASESGWRGSVYEVSSALGIASGKLRDLWDFIALRLGNAAQTQLPRETRDDE